MKRSSVGEHHRVRIGRRDVRVTNRDKLFFPRLGLKKGDLIAYYVDVAPCVRPKSRHS
jgi:DNA primase